MPDGRASSFLCSLMPWRSFGKSVNGHSLVKLSNDPDKNDSVFYCSAAIGFPHIETVVFSDQEFINRWKAGL